MNSVLERVYEIGIIPVIAFNSVDEAIPLCKALMDGGLPAAEVTFRTACAEECIKKIHEELPNMLLGAGTVLTVDQADRAMAAGASFIVAPGFDPEVCKHVIDKGGIMMQVDVHRRRQRQEREQLPGLQPDYCCRRHLDVQVRQDQGRRMG